MKLVEQTEDYWVERAMQIATAAHKGQTRADGSPYIEHPKRVAAAVASRLRPIAWLHDVIEDTRITLEDLKKEGFPSYVVDAVDLLTHRNHEPNVDYWRKIMTNKDATAVKIADIHDNLAGSPTDYQVKKYAKALAAFQAAGFSV